MAPSEKSARRHAILSAAAELLARWSLTDITMDRIAARVGISKGTVYLYFRTKESLFLSLFEELHTRWHVDLREHLASSDHPVEARDAAQIITTSLVTEKLLMRLYAVPLPVLEKDLTPETSAAVNRQRGQRIDETASVLNEKIPAINIVQARQFLKRIGWVIAGLAQASASTTETAAARIDFATELQSIVTLLLKTADTPPCSRSGVGRSD